LPWINLKTISNYICELTFPETLCSWCEWLWLARCGDYSSSFCCFRWSSRSLRYILF